MHPFEAGQTSGPRIGAAAVADCGQEGGKPVKQCFLLKKRREVKLGLFQVKYVQIPPIWRYFLRFSRLWGCTREWDGDDAEGIEGEARLELERQLRPYRRGGCGRWGWPCFGRRRIGGNRKSLLARWAFAGVYRDLGSGLLRPVESPVPKCEGPGAPASVVYEACRTGASRQTREKDGCAPAAPSLRDS